MYSPPLVAELVAGVPAGARVGDSHDNLGAGLAGVAAIHLLPVAVAQLLGGPAGHLVAAPAAASIVGGLPGVGEAGRARGCTVALRQGRAGRGLHEAWCAV